MIEFGLNSICWSQLYLFLNSTVFLAILTNFSEIDMTYIQIRSWCAHIGPRNTREGKTWVRKSTLKTGNSVMELILIILKMASGNPWPLSFPRGAQQIGNLIKLNQ